MIWPNGIIFHQPRFPFSASRGLQGWVKATLDRPGGSGMCHLNNRWLQTWRLLRHNPSVCNRQRWYTPKFVVVNVNGTVAHSTQQKNIQPQLRQKELFPKRFGPRGQGRQLAARTRQLPEWKSHAPRRKTRTFRSITG